MILDATQADFDEIVNGFQSTPAPKPPPPSPFKIEPTETFEPKPDENLEPRTLPFDNPVDFHNYFFPEFKLHPWQEEELYRLAGFPNGRPETAEPILHPSRENPCFYNLIAANSSGKDACIIAPWSLWLLTCKPRYKVVGTTNSHEQMKTQTESHMKRYADRINQKLGAKLIEYVEFKLTCKISQGVIILRVTDEPGKAEGHHPDPGGSMAVFINEAKSIPDVMFSAYMRLEGYSYWVEISSPGDCSGHFYRSSMAAPDVYPAPLQLSRRYRRRISAFDCLHISRAHIEMVRQTHGENSLWYRSSILAEFTSIDDSTLIAQESLNYTPPAFIANFGVSYTRAGFDPALGGDEAVISIWRGNREIALKTTQTKDKDVLIAWAIEIFKTYQIRAENIYMDRGGIGLPIYQDLVKAGWPVHAVLNESRARNPNNFANQITEDWYRVKRLIELELIILPKDEATRTQLCTRRYDLNKGKIALEPKKKCKSRGLPSPDRADALVLAQRPIVLRDVVKIKSDQSLIQKPAPRGLDSLTDEGRAMVKELEDKKVYGETGVGIVNMGKLVIAAPPTQLGMISTSGRRTMLRQNRFLAVNK